jgi:hypothetical protein
MLGALFLLDVGFVFGVRGLFLSLYMPCDLRYLVATLFITLLVSSCKEPHQSVNLPDGEPLREVAREYDSTVFKDASKRLARGQNLSAEQIEKFASAPETRADFYALLWDFQKQEIFPKEYYNFEKATESRLVEWLMYPTELDTIPSKIEFIKRLTLHENDSTFTYYVYRFKTEKPHWAAKDGWILGVVGPYFKDSQPYDWPKGTFSRFKKIRESTPAEEVAWAHTNTFRTNNK